MSAKEAIEQRLMSIGPPKDSQFNNNEPLLLQWNKSLEKFSNQIEQYYIENRQTKDEFEQKLDILHEIEDYLSENVFNKPINGVKYEMKAVVPFGSSASGLGMTGGDLDMIVCVHPPYKRPRKQKTKTKERSNDILKVIFDKIVSRQMLKTRELEDMEHIDGARVPIITGIVDGVEIDISISLTEIVSAQYLSSKFIDAYEKHDRRFILLAAFVKAWQKSKKTEENEDYFSKVFPNSCSTVLLVIFFMKHYKLLPNINKKYSELSDARATWPRVCQGENGSFGIPKHEVDDWKRSNTCQVSVGTLFFLFLDFYANVMSFTKYKMVIADGSVREKQKKKDRVHRIMIEDVIDSDNPAKSVTEEGMLG